MPPLSMKELDRSVPIIPTKGWNVRSLAFLGCMESPEASTETRPPDLWLLAQLPCCFCAWKTPQELPVTQLARHVNLFHLVIADNQRPETPSPVAWPLL
jgi:hypothetical protein